MQPHLAKTKMATRSLLLILCASMMTLLAVNTAALRVQLKRLGAKGNFTTAEGQGLLRAGTLIRGVESASGVTVPIISEGSGFYLYVAEFGIGNPPQLVRAIVSTSSNVVWTQCSTCARRCFRQNLDFYNYSKSSTGQPVSCGDTMCVAGRHEQDYGGSDYRTKPCVGEDYDGMCRTQDADFTGVLRIDEFTFGPAKVNIAFGCMRGINDAVGQWDYGGASGYLGLGRGALSLLAQVGSNRFSYCLTRHHDLGDSSPLFIGSSAGLSGDTPVISTHFAINPHVEPFSSLYYLSMSGLSVGEALLDIPTEAFDGGVVLDTEYPYMSLVDVAYMALKNEISRKLGSSLVPSPVRGLELCVARGDVSRMMAPLVVHFGGGDLPLPANSYWAPMDSETSCMMVVSSAGIPPPWNETNIIGNYMQQNIHVLYDLESESVSFQPADCSSI